LDSGPAIAQAAVAVRDDDTAETLAKRVLEAEHRLYPSALRLIAEGRVRLENRHAVFRDCPSTDGMLQNPMG
jgi:phosphoribosylglycinamide formyltransferase 1